MGINPNVAFAVATLVALLAARPAVAQTQTEIMMEAAELCVEALEDFCDLDMEDILSGEFTQDQYTTVCSQTCRTAIGGADSCVNALGDPLVRNFAQTSIDNTRSVATVCDCCTGSDPQCIANWKAGQCGTFASIGAGMAAMMPGLANLGAPLTDWMAGLEAAEEQLNTVFEPVSDACGVDVNDMAETIGPNSEFLTDQEEYAALCGTPCGSALTTAKAKMSALEGTNPLAGALQGSVFSSLEGLRTVCGCCPSPVNATCLANWRSGGCGDAPQIGGPGSGGTAGNGGTSGGGIQDIINRLEVAEQAIEACVASVETVCPGPETVDPVMISSQEYDVLCGATCQGALVIGNTCLTSTPVEGIVASVVEETRDSMIKLAAVCECCPFPIEAACMEAVKTGACGSSSLGRLNPSDSAAAPQHATLWLLAGLLALVAALF